MSDLDKSALLSRVARLGELQGPILVDGCGEGGDLPGRVYYKHQTGRIKKQVKAIRRKHRETAFYRELVLRALDSKGDPIWDEFEIKALLEGGIDPSDAAYILSAIWAELEGDKDTKSAPFSAEQAAARFKEVNQMYGPVKLPGAGMNGEDLPIFWRARDGMADCACMHYETEEPDDAKFRTFIHTALNAKGARIFSDTEEDLTLLLAAYTEQEITDVLVQMEAPRFMSAEKRVRMRVEIDEAASIDEDDLKNSSGATDNCT